LTILYTLEACTFASYMRAVHYKIRAWILQFIDLFYPLFRPIMTLQMYRYAACGGGNTVFNIFLYFITYNYLLDKEMVHLGFITISAHIAALIGCFFITFPIGFYLSMYVVFQGSFLKRRTQFVRYFMVAIACIFLNYFFLKLFVEKFGWYPTPSMIINTGIVTAFSYFSQRYFSFRQTRVVTKAEKEINL
jgi:putative flippase GtrA